MKSNALLFLQLAGESAAVNQTKRRLPMCAGETAYAKILSWAEVSEIHKTRNGIYQRNGRLISLLTDFGKINPCYPDNHGDKRDIVFYTGSGRRGDQKLDAANQALLNAVGKGYTVPLYNKLAVGRWELVGHFCVKIGVYVYDDECDRMVWKFTLLRSFCDDRA